MKAEKRVIYCAVVSSVLLMGCAQNNAGGFSSLGGAPDSPVSSLSEESLLDFALPAGAGAAIGGVIGGTIGNNVGDGNAARGAAIGAGVGAAAGLAVGAILAERRKAFSTEAALLDSEIAVSNDAVQAKSSEIAKARQDLVFTRSKVQNLQARRASRARVRQDALALQAELQGKIAGYDETLQDYQSSIDYLDELLANPRPSPGEDVTTLREKRESLRIRRDELDQQFRELNGIRNDNELSLNQVNQILAA